MYKFNKCFHIEKTELLEINVDTNFIQMIIAQNVDMCLLKCHVKHLITYKILKLGFLKTLKCHFSI